jgi:hypothetical protein
MGRTSRDACSAHERVGWSALRRCLAEHPYTSLTLLLHLAATLTRGCRNALPIRPWKRRPRQAVHDPDPPTPAPCGHRSPAPIHSSRPATCLQGTGRQDTNAHRGRGPSHREVFPSIRADLTVSGPTVSSPAVSDTTAAGFDFLLVRSFSRPSSPLLDHSGPRWHWRGPRPSCRQ